MTESYLQGAIAQAIERTRALSGVIDRPYAGAYDGLRTICNERLRNVQASLRRLEAETVVNEALQTPRRVRMYQHAIEALCDIEAIGVTALATASADRDSDAADLNLIIRTMCRDLSYPLISPTVTNTSASHLSIYAGFNLVMVPLLEGRFLLHLPDIYHELAHPFLDPHFDDRPILDGYRDAFKQSLLDIKAHFAEARLIATRERAAEDFTAYLHLWEWLWTNRWLEEFFCDAFAALTCGPAYGWAHYHLTARTAENVFETPFQSSKTHPADDARMRLILEALTKLGFSADAESIGQEWAELTRVKECERPPEYISCYPDTLIVSIAKGVLRSVRDMNVTLAVPGAMTTWPDQLNAAWTAFWDDPIQYPEWEKNALRLAKASISRV